MLERFKTIQEVAKEWELTPRQIQSLCALRKISRVGNFGNAWAIPRMQKNQKTEEKPQDNIKIGEKKPE